VSVSALSSFAAAAPVAAQVSAGGADRELARQVFRELCEIDTTQSSGDTHRAALAMAARLSSAGFPAADVRVFETAPKRGNLVARLRGTGKKKPLLLLAHTDVVQAKRADWSTDQRGSSPPRSCQGKVEMSGS
jgi:acetylornithine deacetylase/succinyl-diaminopimelate desuccinylase-like protein